MDRHPEEERAADATHEQSAEELLARLERGEAPALGELIRREMPRALRRLRKRIPEGLRRRFGESDVLQLTAEDLMRLRGRFENHGEAAFAELFDVIARRNLAGAIDREMAQKRSPRLEQRPPATETDAPGFVEQAAVDTASPSRLLAQEELVARLQACYAELEDADREIIDLVDHQDLGCTGAAHRLGISASTARKRHSRAIARLREAMGRARGVDESV